MICLVALVVFSILGIFSVKYRKLAFTAFDCVFRRVTLRPCQSGMDRKLKNRLIGLISRKNVKLARFVVKHFELVSWIFTFIMLISLFFSVRGLYFYAVYGNCNGANSNDFCVFDALNPSSEEVSCSDPSLIGDETNFIKPNVDDDPTLGSDDAKVTIIEFGCYSCPYTKEAEPVVKQIIEDYKGQIRFVFRDFSLPTHVGSEKLAIAAYCADQQGNFWEFRDSLFEKQSYDDGSVEFKECLTSAEALSEVKKDFEDGKLAGVYGTPTFFINDVVVVGPKPYRYFKNIIEKELKK